MECLVPLKPASFAIDTKSVSAITDARTLRRGGEYARSGQVGPISEKDGSIEAAVHGTHPYHTRLWYEDGNLRSSCTCPVGEDGLFCKHSVALALAWLGEGPAAEDGEPAPEPSEPITEHEIRKHLMGRKKSELVDLLLSLTIEDEHLLRRLMIGAATTERQGQETTVLRHVIDNAVHSGGYIGYHEVFSYVRGIEDAVDGVEQLMASGQASSAMELAEYALRAVEKAMDSIHDSDGDLRGVLDRLQDIHLRACLKARPDGKALAQRLFTWEMESDWEVFFGAVSTYKDVLRPDGLAVYRALAEKEWAKVPILGPGQKDPEGFHDRFRITHIMETLASQTGDLDQLVAVKSRDLSCAYHFLDIAQEYKKAGYADLALQWAEQGLRAYPEKTDSRLREFLAEEYHGLKRNDEAMILMWKEFVESPGLDGFQVLKSHADRFKAWPDWRARAIEHLRTLIAGEKAASKKERWAWGARADSSTIVRILLWEKDHEAAWHEAQQGGCSEELWLELAGRREKQHPEDALPIYQRRIEPILDRKNNEAYREAVQKLQIVRRLMKALGRESEFPAYLEKVRSAHKQKRNFMKLLAQMSWR